MALVKGTDLRVFIAGNKIINEQTCDIELTASMIETSSKDSGDWATAIPGRKSWGISATFQVDYDDPATTTTYDIIQAAWMAGTSLTVTFKTLTALGTVLTGQAFVESMPVKSGDQTIATCDLKLRGTGVLTPTVTAA
jgi:predicted secreted protein